MCVGPKVSLSIRNVSYEFYICMDGGYGGYGCCACTYICTPLFYLAGFTLSSKI